MTRSRSNAVTVIVAELPHRCFTDSQRAGIQRSIPPIIHQLKIICRVKILAKSYFIKVYEISKDFALDF